MFMKQYNYKPRTSSQSSGTSGQAAAGSPPKEEAKPAGGAGIAQQAMGGTGAGATAGAAGRRRSSAGADKFAGLNAVKRSSQDQSQADRKASWADQKPGQGGILGNMWTSFTKGS